MPHHLNIMGIKVHEESKTNKPKKLQLCPDKMSKRTLLVQSCELSITVTIDFVLQ